jgi:hypothetical protein
MFRRARRRTRTIPQRFSLLLGQNSLFRLEHSLFAFKILCSIEQGISTKTLDGL